jgi:hypothetical protein
MAVRAPCEELPLDRLPRLPPVRGCLLCALCWMHSVQQHTAVSPVRAPASTSISPSEEILVSMSVANDHIIMISPEVFVRLLPCRESQRSIPQSIMIRILVIRGRGATQSMLRMRAAAPCVFLSVEKLTLFSPNGWLMTLQHGARALREPRLDLTAGKYE